MIGSDRKGSRFLAILCSLLIPVGCSRQLDDSAAGAKAPVSADSAVVSRVLPILDDVQTCAWQQGAAEDRSGGLVPGPSAAFIRGYAIISRPNVECLKVKYRWTPSSTVQTDLELPQGTAIPEIGAELLESQDLIDNLPAISAYHHGRILFCPKDGFVYFDLIKD